MLDTNCPQEKFQFSFCNVIAEVVAQTQTEIYGQFKLSNADITSTAIIRQGGSQAELGEAVAVQISKKILLKLSKV